MKTAHVDYEANSEVQEDLALLEVFSLDFPDAAVSDELLEAKYVLPVEQEEYIDDLLPALKKAAFISIDFNEDKLANQFISAIGGKGYKLDNCRVKLWSTSYLVTCPTFDDGSSFAVSKVVAKGDPLTLGNKAVELWQKDIFKDSTKSFYLSKEYKSALKTKRFPIPAFVCIKPEDCISQELYSQVKEGAAVLPRLKNFGKAFEASKLGNAIVIGAYFLEGRKQPELRIPVKVREKFCNGLGDFSKLPGVLRELKSDDPLKGTDPGTPVQVEEEEITTETPAEEKPADLKVDFNSEDFKVALKDLGFSESEVSRLYSTGALKAIYEIFIEELNATEGD